MIYKKPAFEFNSVFPLQIRDYIELREAFGAKFSAQSGVLRQFDRFCVQMGVQATVLDANLANDWLKTKRGEKPSSRAHRISTLNCFAKYLASVGKEVSWFPHPGYAGRLFRYVPYIYTREQVVHILEVADNLPKPGRRSMFHLVFPTVLKILYCCGLRISEALALRVKDVDLESGFIFVECGKFENSRRLPIAKSLLESLRKYRVANQAQIGVDANGFFFPNTRGEQYSQRTVYDKFRTVLWKSGIPHQGQGKGPRVHDFRHTFAVNSLQKSIQAGIDPYVSMPVLMAYMGHSKLSSTEYYLRLTADIYPDFLEKANTVCAAAIPEVSSYEN